MSFIVRTLYVLAAGLNFGLWMDNYNAGLFMGVFVAVLIDIFSDEVTSGE